LLSPCLRLLWVHPVAHQGYKLIRRQSSARGHDHHLDRCHVRARGGRSGPQRNACWWSKIARQEMIGGAWRRGGAVHDYTREDDTNRHIVQDHDIRLRQTCTIHSVSIRDPVFLTTAPVHVAATHSRPTHDSHSLPISTNRLPDQPPSRNSSH